MDLKKFIVASAFALGASFTAANAAVIENVSGNVCEGGVPPAVGAPCPSAFDLGDFNTTADDPTLQIIGDTRIWGGVANRNADAGKYFDNFKLDLGAHTYTLTFNYQFKSGGDDGVTDGRIVIGGVTYEWETPPDGSISAGSWSGMQFVSIDPIFGDQPDSPDEVITWDLEISRVPLPAAGWMLIAGLGGLGAMRRFRKS